MFELVFVSVGIGFLLILLLKRSTTSIVVEKDYYEEPDALTGRFERWELSQFEKVCLKLLEELGLEVRSIAYLNTREFDLVACDPKPVTGGDFIIHCLLAPPGEIVEANRVIALSDVVRTEKASKGIFITTGYFSADTANLPEGAPLELINAKRLKQLILEHDLLA
ncbi:MAG: restriction endonuclease [Candidatus Tectomicrobia bacterium]|uniref:Restriction endonuclease n=1 Tax=Tectimicrobiota bacterium TaxID=2528274 RepID=A0A932CRT7_UNCTE|nr:restriction endonuclease [Candidatus Tectomicrobia bacterium]